MDRKTNLETSLVIVTGLLIIYILNDWQSILILALVIGIIGVFLDKPASLITWLWYKIADILGKIIPKIILGVVFFVFLFPISLLARLFNNKKGNKNNGKSMWIERDHVYTKNDLSKPW